VSSLVVSCQQVYNGLTVTAVHYEVFFGQPCSLFPNFSSIILPTDNIGDPLSSRLIAYLELRNSAPSSSADSRSCLRSSLYKHRFLYYCVLIHCFIVVFTAPVRSNERGADHRKHCSSIVACVRFHGNVFTQPLPSRELLLLLGVMSQYIKINVQLLITKTNQRRERLMKVTQVDFTKKDLVRSPIEATRTLWVLQ
jgi:hypothetical protein